MCLGFTNPVETGRVLGVCLCLCCVSVGSWWEAWARVWKGGVVLCICEL